ncbi:MAG: hemerythrin domain-containing protein [Gammaproteobacteria bacterium]|nr:hemerythrin domain-containing protein [Gammaproteobacteria bacterium]
MAIENPIHELTHEHKYILKVVHGLAVIDEKLAQNEKVEPELLLRVVDFMQNFADRCHHAKEEAVLFPAMEEKGVPKSGCPLSALLAEHVKGRELVTALKDAADSYTDGNPEVVAEIRRAIGGVRHLYPNHIWKEDEMVFPMAERLFAQDELEKLKIRFDDAEVKFGRNHDRYIVFANEMELLLGSPET